MNLEDLRAVVRAGGAEPTPVELAETLWLAAQIRTAAAGRPPLPAPPARPAPGRAAATPPGPPDPGPPPPAPVPPPAPAAQPPPVELHPFRAPRGPARPAGVAEVPRPIALAGRLAFQRALHPLLRRVPVAGLGTLDEEATATRAADHPRGARWPAVMRPPAGLWLDAIVVVDAGDSMAIWQGLATEIIEVLRESGVFRQVARHRLTGAGPQARLADWQDRTVAPRRLVDPVNRRVVFVVSDCVGPVWRSGSAGAMLRDWARRGPVAVLQPLPARLWARTAAPTVAGTLTAPRPCAPNADLRFAAFGGRDAPDGPVVPVLEIDSVWLHRWCTLVAGGPPITAAVTAAGPPAAPDQVRTPPLTPDQRVRAFRAHSSREAFELARYVALGEPLLDVIRYIHDAMFPTASPAHLAELLLSGLLHAEDPKLGRYRFVDGVPELLLSTLTVSETLQADLVRQRVSVSVSGNLTARRPRFPTLVPGGGEERLGGDSRPFAVTALGRRHIDRARRRLTRAAPAADHPGTGPGGPARTPGPADLVRLLDPRGAVPALRHRDSELDALLAWCATTGGGTSVMLLSGPAGTGKSRLWAELVRRLPGWRSAGGRAPLPPGDGPVLIVADRADQYADHVLDPLPPPTDRPVRLLIVARSAGEWWRDLLTDAEARGFTTAGETRLDRFAAGAATPAALQGLVTELAGHLYPGGGSAVTRARHTVAGWAADLGAATPADWVILACQALSAAGTADYLRHLADGERWYAERSAVRTGISFATPDRLDFYRAAAQLYGASGATEAHETARRISAPDGTDPERTRRITTWLYELYPGPQEDNYWSPLPHALRRRLVLSLVGGDHGLLTLLGSVTGRQAARALDLLVPACPDTPGLMPALWRAAAGHPALHAGILRRAARSGGIGADLLALARETVTDRATPVALLRAVVDGVPRIATLFAGQPRATADALVAAIERLAALSAPHRRTLADAFRERGRLGEHAGQDADALQDAEYELDLRRRLAAAGPGTAELARTLTAYALRLERAHRPLHGLAAVTEAIQLLDRLRGDPATAPARAHALVCRARLLGDLGRADEAVDAASEGVARYRDLDPAGPTELAEALLVEAAQARAAGRPDLAVRAGAEAVERYDELTATGAGDVRSRLAYACCAHGMDLADLGSHAAGLALLDRAVALYRELAANAPSRLPGVATAQTGRGLLLAELEHLDQAEDAFADAAAVYRTLAPDGEPGPATAALAGVLTMQGQTTALTGRFDDALGLLTTACRLRERIHTADPLDAGARHHLAFAYQCLAELHERRGEGEPARAHATQARLLRGDL
ncbi:MULTISPECIES: tetratricopeptide repeat protein [Actinoplanes]|uniref:tetratricopeptide repeat protein n=1 Tax=Actinoplanes TaxID=1865 RepID=UPI000697424A|nr:MULTISPECIES: tetratricopeptide repeat protein [Actinoplanes]GLY04325.1 hypothetical protein Acsp01_47040 [Actinoplanes sp. NBRC 101535]